MVRPVSGDTEYSSPQNTTVTLLWITIRSPNPCRYALAPAANDVRLCSVTGVCGGLLVSVSRLPCRPGPVHPPPYSAGRCSPADGVRRHGRLPASLRGLALHVGTRRSLAG